MCIYVYCILVWSPWKSEEGVRSLRTGLTRSYNPCKPVCGCMKSRLGLLQEQCSLLLIRQSSSKPSIFFLVYVLKDFTFQKKIVENVFPPLSKDKLSKFASVSGFSVLFHLSNWLFFCQYPTVLIIVVLYTSLEIGYRIHCLILFISFRIVLTIIDLLPFTQEHPTFWHRHGVVICKVHSWKLYSWFTKKCKKFSVF